MRFLTCFFILVFANMQVAWAGACASDAEYNAINIRALQSQLMVAALSCGSQRDYNKFMTKYKRQLHSKHGDLQRYFSRVHQGGSKSRMNNFITNLANTSSKRSLKTNIKKYCKKSAALFDEVLSGSKNSLIKAASSLSVRSLHPIKSCNRTQLVRSE